MRRQHVSRESCSRIANEWYRSMIIQSRWVSTHLPSHLLNGRGGTQLTDQGSPRKIRGNRICRFGKNDGPCLQDLSSISLRRADRGQKERGL
jgi:hypothetical protein